MTNRAQVSDQASSDAVLKNQALPAERPATDSAPAALPASAPVRASSTAPVDAPVLVLTNLGTPKSPTTKDVRRYLREFLSDKRVIEMPGIAWKPILEGVILRVRPAQSAAKYRSVWLKEGSPLLHYTTRQAELLSERLGVRVLPAMRYGEPSLPAVLDRLMAEGHRRIGVLSAYPQYSATTIASVNDAVCAWMRVKRDQPELRLSRSFPVDPAYIEALAGAIEDSWGRNGRPDFAAGDRLLLSFHSIPVAMHRAGDPYRGECLATTEALRERLGLGDEDCVATFQSVFGPAEWLTPATIDTVEGLGRSGSGRVDVVCPGFVSDCLETLEEIDQLNREAFMEAGGSQFHYIPWGNDAERAIDALEVQARSLLAGWVA